MYALNAILHSNEAIPKKRIAGIASRICDPGGHVEIIDPEDELRGFPLVEACRDLSNVDKRLGQMLSGSREIGYTELDFVWIMESSQLIFLILAGTDSRMSQMAAYSLPALNWPFDFVKRIETLGLFFRSGIGESSRGQ